MPTPYPIGCVSYLNSKPLIDPLVHDPRVEVHFAVPAMLLDLVERHTVAAALLPIVDYHRCSHPLVLVPAGAIGSDGPTYTVRLFSPSPPAQVHTLYADTDSHTSVVLAQVLLREAYGLAPRVLPCKPGATPPKSVPGTAYLYIGDKVVTAAPPADAFPHTLDLGDAWKKLTGLPFVFAMWMMPADRVDPALIGLLAAAQRAGASRTSELVERYAGPAGWPPALAHRYFTQYLQYTVTPAARAGIARFYQLAAQHGLLTATRPVRYADLPEPEHPPDTGS